jgi:hypothetical protein
MLDSMPRAGQKVYFIYEQTLTETELAFENIAFFVE